MTRFGRKSAQYRARIPALILLRSVASHEDSLPVQCNAPILWFFSLFVFRRQSCGSMTFWYGSGSVPLTNGSGSCHFSSLTFKTPTNKYFLKVFCWFLFEGTFTSFKFIKSENSRNLGFSHYFCLMIKGAGSGSTPLTNGSGSGRPKTSLFRRWMHSWINKNLGLLRNSSNSLIRNGQF